jgi:protein-tyrosine phosphatase
MDKIALLFVCLGNICRSPTAEGVMRAKVRAAGLADAVHIDSAGTGDWHIGACPDARAQQAALRRGYALDALRARQVAPADFSRFDLILAMDHDNVSALHRQCPPEHVQRIRLLMSFASAHGADIVRDPYFGGDTGFERALDEIEDACDGLMSEVLLRLAMRADPPARLTGLE